MPSFTHDVLIIGHGLAGAVLVQQLRQRGLSHHVFDLPQEGQASTVAAGLVNPIAMRRDVLTWRAPEMLATAGEAYFAAQQQLGEEIWHPCELVKIFPTPAEAGQWSRAMDRLETAPFLSRKEQPWLQRNGISAPHGYGTVSNCAWLDLRRMLQLQRQRLIDQGELTETHIGGKDIGRHAHGVSIGAFSAPWVVHCAGPFAQIAGLVPVKGEVLTVRLPALDLQQAIHRGIFLLPIGGDRYRIGATYVWTDTWSGPTAQARDHLLGKLKEVVPVRPEVLEHQAGVRPAARDRRPILGVSAPGEAVFNGLGSRGVLLAPWCATHLLDHLFLGRPITPEVDLQRFTRP